MKLKKTKRMALVLAIALALTAIPVTPAYAYDDFTAEPIMTDVTYSGSVGSDNDVYKIVMPATMRLNVRILDLSYSWIRFTVYDKNWDTVDSDSPSEGDTCYYYLKEGETYYFEVSPYVKGSDYTIQFFYVVSEPTATVSSSKKGKMVVKAPNSDAKELADGYEIRYRLSGKSWTTKKVETTASLNTTISGLKSGKTYTVQVRRYVEDDNNKLYTSAWSDKVKVKVK